jgi:hypothetical protein
VNIIEVSRKNVLRKFRSSTYLVVLGLASSADTTTLAELEEVLGGDGGVSVKAEDDLTSGGTVDGDVEENVGEGLSHC